MSCKFRLSALESHLDNYLIQNISEHPRLITNSGEWNSYNDFSNSKFLNANSSIGGHPPQEQATLKDEQEHTQQNVAFNSPEQETIINNNSKVDSTMMSVVDTAHTDLGRFLERPVLIDTREINLGESIQPGTATINVWKRFLRSPSIIKKIEHYSYIRGTLHLKFQISGGPTYYGRIIAAYDPYSPTLTPRSRPLYESDQNLPPVGGGLCKLSQRPHIILDPCESQGGEMTCPFVCPFTYVDITSLPTANGTAQGLTAVPEKMGAIDFASFSSLGSTGVSMTNQIGITIQTLAWMTDVVLAAPTEAPVASDSLWANSGSKWDDDEYGKGVVSRPASAIARWAGHLEKVPVIGPFATATHIASGAVSTTAKLFGFSKPVITTPIMKYKPTFAGNLATTDIDDSAEKLTFDTKQELTVDHNIIGKECEDELTVSAIATKSAFVENFMWSSTDDADQVLARINVEPMACPTHHYKTNEYLRCENFLTPLAFASLPFREWRGGIRYRFMVHSSNFHRGKLKITYEPRAGVNQPTLGPTNTRYTRIVDIGTQKDFHLDVNWMQNAPYKRIRKPRYPDDGALGMLTHSPRLSSMPASQSVSLNLEDEYANGQIFIQVFNKLVSPLETDAVNSPITISWFIAGLQDYEVADPTPDFGKYTVPYCREVGDLIANSGEYANAAGSSKYAKEGNTHDTEALEPIGSRADFPAQNLVHYGETFHSFRNMMKRYCFYEDVICPGKTGDDNEEIIFKLESSNFPKPYGPSKLPPGDYTAPSINGERSFHMVLARTNLISYLEPAFVAKRGGIRWKYVYSSDNTVNQHKGMIVRRLPLDSPVHVDRRRHVEVLCRSNRSMDPQTNMANRTNLFEGASYTPTALNPVAEVEIPFYSHLRFFSPGSIDDAFNRHEVAVEMHNVAGISHDHIESFVATGEDFNLSWFVNAPSIHYHE